MPGSGSLLAKPLAESPAPSAPASPPWRRSVDPYVQAEVYVWTIGPARPLTKPLLAQARQAMKAAAFGMPALSLPKVPWTLADKYREHMCWMMGGERLYQLGEVNVLEMAHSPGSTRGDLATFVRLEIEAHRRGDQTMLRMVPFVNLSPHTIQFEVDGRAYNIEPGGQIDLPQGYTKWRGTRCPIIQELAPQLSPTRIECQTCGILIGQADSSGVLVCWEHNAPCGLPCVGRGTDHLALTLVDGAHQRDKDCPRCCPKTCPACDGKPQIGTEKFVDFMPMYDFSGQPSRLPIEEARPIWCKRCKGTGRVDGLGLYLEEHDL